LSDDDFEQILITNGYIPDLYGSDSSEETLFSKFVEEIVCAWASKIGLSAKCVKQKASYEDVNISINGKMVVCDAKSFRLGRSQPAPNVKDFLKLEDMRKWLARFPQNQQLGGLVAFPSKHEWTSSSDVYLYCSTKSIPTLMLSYEYLALLFHFRTRFTQNDLLKMWNYQTIFPNPLDKKMSGGNKDAYWKAVNQAIETNLKISKKERDDFFGFTKVLTTLYVNKSIKLLEDEVANIDKKVEKEIDEVDYAELKKMMSDYKKQQETEDIIVSIKRIKDFRK